MPEAVIENPTTEHANLTLGGDSFAAKLAERQAAAPEIVVAAPVIDPGKVELPKKDDAPPAKTAEDKKVADTNVDPPAKGRTPLDVAPPKKPDDAPADPEIAELLKSEPPANASASSKANHAAMRKGLEKANGRIQELTAELEQTKGKVGTVPADVEERLKSASETTAKLQAELERVAFERSPRFQKFVSEGQAELASAKSYLEGVKDNDGEAIDPGIIDLAASARGAKRAAILDQSGLNQTTISAITSHLARADAINRDREAAHENWKANQTEWTAEQTKARDAQAAQVKAAEDKVFAEVGKKAAETLAPFQRAEGNDEWNVGVDARLKEAQEYFDGKKPLPETAQLIYDGIAGRVYKDAFEDLRTKYNDLVGETERIKAARPGALDGKVDQNTGPVSTGNVMADAASTFETMRRNRGA